MRVLASFIALGLMTSSPAAAADNSESVDQDSHEYKFAACVNERDRSLLYAMRDASDAAAFEAAIAKAAALCEIDQSTSFSPAGSAGRLPV